MLITFNLFSANWQQSAKKNYMKESKNEGKQKKCLPIFVCFSRHKLKVLKCTNMRSLQKFMILCKIEKCLSEHFWKILDC